ncbi:MAG: hypothetical protein JSS49_29075 [Planctomycetes bacterium]|nr:hypothetical protein [Planctomycetota bacterium]
MLRLGIILSLTLVIVCHSGNTDGGETVVVELVTGQRIRAQSIQRDPQSESRVQLTIGSGQIQIGRNIGWNRIQRLIASKVALSGLQVPESVQIVDTAERLPLRELDLSLEPDQADSNRVQLRSFFRYPPPPPVAEAVPLLPRPDRFEFTGPCAESCDPCVPAEMLMPWMVLRDPGVVVGIRNADPWGPPLSEPSVPYESVPGTTATDSLHATRTTLPTARELLVSARAFNRNGLADWNSLEVSVQGKTASGQPCPVRGSLKCSLWVRRTRVVRAYAENYFEENRDLMVLGQWSQFLDGSEADASGVQKIVLALPPRIADQNLGISSYGQLTVDLDIPGQGRLATSSDPIALVPSSPIRGRSVVDFGNSILPRESVSESGGDAGFWPAPLSSLRPDRRRFSVQP